MSIDQTKLTPAPWRSERRYSDGIEVVPRINCERNADRECGRVADLVGAPYLGYESTVVNAEFIALARNVFDVMMRRGWEFRTVPGCGYCATFTTGHCVDDTWIAEGNKPTMKRFHADPFTCLVEADAWYKANVEAKGTP